MKKLLLSAAALFFANAVFSQVHVDSITCNALAIGSADCKPAAINTIKDLRFIQNRNQLALVASKDSVNCYYFVYNTKGVMLASGKFVKKNAGEYTLVNLGPANDGNYSVVLSTKVVPNTVYIAKTTN